MHKRISKILISFLFILTIFCSWSIDAFAATVFDPWKDDKPSWYSYGFNPSYSPAYIYSVDQNNGLLIHTLPYDNDGSITRTIDDVIYTTSTRVYKSSYTIANPLTFEFPDILAKGWSDGILDPDDPPIYSFSDLDLYYLVNIYGAGAVLLSDDDLHLSAIYTNVTLSNESGVGLFTLDLDCDLVASVKYSAASTTYVVHVSYHTDPFNSILFDLDSDNESYLTLTIGSSRSPMCSTLTDVDFGIIDGRIGTKQYSYDNIWGNIPRPPQVIYNPDTTVSVSEAYDIINGSNLVTSLLVPIGLLAMSFYIARTVLWKGG